MLGVELGAVAELPLEGLAQDRVEGFELPSAEVDARKYESCNKFESFQVILGFRGLLEVFGCERPHIHKSLQG